VQVKLTVRGELFQPFPFGAGEIASVIAGGVFAIFRLTCPIFELPAASVTVPETVCPAPSVVIVRGEGQLVMGDEDCVHVKLTVTSVLFHARAFGKGEVEPAMDGSANSRFSVTLAGAEVLPATSVAAPDTIRFGPLEETRIGCGHCATPDGESEQWNVTVTFVLFQPAELAIGKALAVIDGGVLSMLTVTPVVAPTPALFVAVPCTA